MKDLEKEFAALVKGMHDELSKKQESGELSEDEAYALREMLWNRVPPSSYGFDSSSSCSDLGSDYYDYQYNWQGSSC